MDKGTNASHIGAKLFSLLLVSMMVASVIVIALPSDENEATEIGNDGSATNGFTTNKPFFIDGNTASFSDERGISWDKDTSTVTLENFNMILDNGEKTQVSDTWYVVSALIIREVQKDVTIQLIGSNSIAVKNTTSTGLTNCTAIFSYNSMSTLTIKGPGTLETTIESSSLDAYYAIGGIYVHNGAIKIENCAITSIVGDIVAKSALISTAITGEKGLTIDHARIYAKTGSFESTDGTVLGSYNWALSPFSGSVTITDSNITAIAGKLITKATSNSSYGIAADNLIIEHSEIFAQGQSQAMYSKNSVNISDYKTAKGSTSYHGTPKTDIDPNSMTDLAQYKVVKISLYADDTLTMVAIVACALIVGLGGIAYLWMRI